MCSTSAGDRNSSFLGIIRKEYSYVHSVIYSEVRAPTPPPSVGGGGGVRGKVWG